MGGVAAATPAEMVCSFGRAMPCRRRRMSVCCRGFPSLPASRPLLHPRWWTTTTRRRRASTPRCACCCPAGCPGCCCLQCCPFHSLGASPSTRQAYAALPSPPTPCPAYRDDLQATKHTRLSTFPPYLLVQMRRYCQNAAGQPQKLEVLVAAPESLDLQALRATGLQVEGWRRLRWVFEFVCVCWGHCVCSASVTAGMLPADCGVYRAD